MTKSKMLSLSKSFKFALAFSAICTLQAQAKTYPLEGAVDFVFQNKTIIAVATTAAVSVAACTLYNNPEAAKEFYDNLVKPKLEELKPHLIEIFSPVSDLIPQETLWILSEGSAAKILAKNFVAHFTQQTTNFTKNILLETIKNPQTFINMTHTLLN